MPHKDREARLAYLREWKKRKRPAPVPKPQADPTLPAHGVVEFSDDGSKVRCHVCGKWLGSLNTHLRAHGMDAASYKEAFDLPRTASLWPPSLKALQREAALDRDQGAIGRGHIPPATGRAIGQEARLGTRIEASAARSGIYTRGGKPARKS